MIVEHKFKITLKATNPLNGNSFTAPVTFREGLSSLRRMLGLAEGNNEKEDLKGYNVRFVDNGGSKMPEAEYLPDEKVMVLYVCEGDPSTDGVWWPVYTSVVNEVEWIKLCRYGRNLHDAFGMVYEVSTTFGRPNSSGSPALLKYKAYLDYYSSNWPNFPIYGINSELVNAAISCSSPKFALGSGTAIAQPYAPVFTHYEGVKVLVELLEKRYGLRFPITSINSGNDEFQVVNGFTVEIKLPDSDCKPLLSTIREMEVDKLCEVLRELGVGFEVATGVYKPIEFTDPTPEAEPSQELDPDLYWLADEMKVNTGTIPAAMVLSKHDLDKRKQEGLAGGTITTDKLFSLTTKLDPTLGPKGKAVEILSKHHEEENIVNEKRKAELAEEAFLEAYSNKFSVETSDSFADHLVRITYKLPDKVNDTVSPFLTPSNALSYLDHLNRFTEPSDVRIHRAKGFDEASLERLGGPEAQWLKDFSMVMADKPSSLELWAHSGYSCKERGRHFGIVVILNEGLDVASLPVNDLRVE